MWGQREPTSHAKVTFTLLFDRNQWPPAYTTNVDQVGGPGLTYPVPTGQQVSRLSAELQADVMDVLGEWDPSLKATQEDQAGVLGPDWEAWSAGQSPTEAGRERQGNGSSLHVRVIDVVVTSVRAPAVPRRVQDPDAPRVLTPVPPQEAPYLPMEVDVEVRIGPLPSVLYRRRGWEEVQRGRSAGTLAQQLAGVLHGERAGSEGGAWLPAAVPGSVGVYVQLPCLHGGVGRDA